VFGAKFGRLAVADIVCDFREQQAGFGMERTLGKNRQRGLPRGPEFFLANQFARAGEMAHQSAGRQSDFNLGRRRFFQPRRFCRRV
jgi:hypothetical protein